MNSDKDYKVFLCDYKYKNNTYSIKIYAVSFEDARKRLNAIKENGEIIGELKYSIPLPNYQLWLKIFKKLLKLL